MSPLAHLEVRGAATPEERAQADDLIAKTQLVDYWVARRWLDTVGRDMPGFKLEHTRIAWVDGEMAGALRLITADLRIGKARWKTGGFGWVSTIPAFRNSGVCRALIEDTHAYMAANHYHAAQLFGIANFYHRFGYTVSLADHTIRLEVSSIADLQDTTLDIRPLREEHIPHLLRLHDLHEEKASCSMVRTAEDWKNQFREVRPVTPLGADWHRAMGLFDGQGRLTAYFSPQTERDGLHIKEIGTESSSVHPALLQTCVNRAREQDKATIVFHLPPFHPFARFLEDFDSHHTTEHYRCREGMMILINPGAALTAMLPEWDAQLAESAARNRPASFTVQTGGLYWCIKSDGVRVTIHANEKCGPVAAIAGETLLRWTTGFAHVEDWLELHGQGWGANESALLRAIFPKRNPFVWPADHY